MSLRMTKDEIDARIKLGLRILVYNDQYLLSKDLQERAIAHKLANYYEGLFKDWDVDCEYNRNLDSVKTVDNKDDKDRILPDIVIHKRGNHDNNLAVIEIKKTTNCRGTGRESDFNKLSKLVEEPYNYKYAYFIDIPTGDDFTGVSTEFSIAPHGRFSDKVYIVKRIKK